MNKVVAHYQDGRLIKGLTSDFHPAKDRFRIFDETAPVGARELEIQLQDLKAVFFVRDLEGDLGHAKSNIFAPEDATPGDRLRVLFKDGEIMKGISRSYKPGRPGFFMVPADRRSNTEQAWIITAAAADISFT